MMLNFNELLELHPEHLWLEFSTAEQSVAWLFATLESGSNSSVCWNTYLNYLCWNIFLAWLKEEPEWKAVPIVPPEISDLRSIWEFVNGAALSVGKNKLVLIPSDKSSVREFRIPQEWVDISTWAANYYLAVQLNLEECWLRVWGFTTHQQIREKAIYDPIDRTYCLSSEELIADINIMLVAWEVCSPKLGEVREIVNLSPSQVEKLLQQVNLTTRHLPRLSMPFADWAALISSNSTRGQLYNKLHSKYHKLEVSSKQHVINDLSLWLENIFNLGWQSVDAFFTTEHILSANFRSDSVLNEVCVKGAKLIDLGMQLEGQAVVLLVGVTPDLRDQQEKYGIRAQLYPANGETYLLPNIQLTLLGESGKVLQSVQSRSNDNYIQLKRFKSPRSKIFTIQISFDNVSIKESFAIKPLGG